MSYSQTRTLLFNSSSELSSQQSQQRIIEGISQGNEGNRDHGWSHSALDMILISGLQPISVLRVNTSHSNNMITMEK